MCDGLLQQLPVLKITPGATVGPLRVFGLRGPTDSRIDYTMLDNALASGTVEITEVTDQGMVSTLRAINGGDRMVLILAGEQVVGAKQNRVVNASVMVPAVQSIEIPVSCVEKRRWHYRSPRFCSDGNMSHGRLRARISRQTHESARRGELPRSDQQDVWREVERKLDCLGVQSPTNALSDAYAVRNRDLDDAVRCLPVPESCCGAVFVIGNRIAGMDIFNQSSTLVRIWPKLVRSYAADALEESPDATPSVKAGQIRRWLREAGNAVVEKRCPLHKPHPPYRRGGASLNVPESARRGRHVISEARNQPGWVGEGVVADSELRPA